MIYRMYLRTFFVTLSTAVLTIILAPAVYILVGMHISDLITALITGIIILLASGLLFYFYKITKANDRGSNPLDYKEIDTVIFKNDIWFFKRFMIFDELGRYIGMATMDVRDLRSFLYTFIGALNIIVPIDYLVTDHQGSLICRLRREGFRSAIINIYDQYDNHIGKVEFDELKILLKFKGKVLTEENTYNISSELLFEDVEAHGIMNLSSFNNSIEYHNIFRSMYNEVASFNQPINTEDGKTARALMTLIKYIRKINS